MPEGMDWRNAFAVVKSEVSGDVTRVVFVADDRGRPASAG